MKMFVLFYPSTLLKRSIYIISFKFLFSLDKFNQDFSFVYNLPYMMKFEEIEGKKFKFCTL